MRTSTGLLAAMLVLGTVPAFAGEGEGGDVPPGPRLPDFDAMSPAELAGFARSLDRTGSDEAREIREAFLQAQARAAVAPPSNGMTVTDHGRITVMRDATGDVWKGGTSFSALLSGVEGTPAAFFQARPDADPDFVLIIQDWLNTSFLGAFYMPIENDVRGIGYANGGGPELFDDDLSTGIEGLLWLNGVQILSNDTLIGILWGQEFGHRWGSFVHFDDGGTRSKALLGRDEAHWSYYLDTDWSWFEGNDWNDNGDGTWSTANGTFDGSTHYSSLDLYLMGLVGTGDVPAFTLLTGPSGGPEASAPPQAWQSTAVETVTAIPKAITVQDVIAVEGERFPNHLTSPKSFDVAVLYVLREGDRINQDKLDYMEFVLDRMLLSWNADVSGLATVDFGPAGTRNEAPVVTLDAPAAAEARQNVRFDASDAVDPEGQALRYFWRFGEAGEFAEGPAVVSHKFGGTGPIPVEVSVQDEDGGETLLTHVIDLSPAPSCGCRLSPAPPPKSTLLLPLAALLLFLRRRPAIR